MKFDETFDEPILFSHGKVLISREKYSHKEALGHINDFIGNMTHSDTVKKLGKDRVRFQMPGDSVADGDDFDGPLWCTGASGKGSKKVWATL